VVQTSSHIKQPSGVEHEHEQTKRRLHHRINI